MIARSQGVAFRALLVAALGLGVPGIACAQDRVERHHGHCATCGAPNPAPRCPTCGAVVPAPIPDERSPDDARVDKKLKESLRREYGDPDGQPPPRSPRTPSP